jgi:hypothetical protein
MGHIFFGITLLLLGGWGIAAHWYQFLDLIWVLVPLGLFFLGIEFLFAGLSGHRDTRYR